MIRVTVELIRARDGERTMLGVMDIANDGVSLDPKIGHYNGYLYRKNSMTVQRTGRSQELASTGVHGLASRVAYVEGASPRGTQ